MPSSSSAPVLPPVEDLFIPEAIDFNFKHNADQPFFTFSDPSASSEPTVISQLEFGRAAHRSAHALRPNRTGADGEVVAIVALSDTILYQAVVAGCIVAGLVPFPISPRSSPPAIINLLQKSACRRLITTNITLKSLIDGLRAQIAETPSLRSFDLQIEEIPSVFTAYPQLGQEKAEHPFERYPDPVKRPSRDDICIYLHSSGSTGFPKAIPQTHRAWMEWSMFPGVADFRDFRPRLTMACMALPAFHTLGLYLQLLNPVYGIVSIALYPPTATKPDLFPVVLSPQNILDHTKWTRSTALIVIPTFLQIWAQSPEATEFLTTLSYVGFSGGSLAPKLGNQLIEAGVHLHPVYGGTEFGAPTHPISLEGKENWEYMRFQDRAKVRWVPQEDGTFECQFLNWENHHPMASNLNDVEGYATSDLFVPHPTREGLWKIVGRIDDVIVHSSGEKTVPAPMEDIITSSPIVQGALIIGREHDQAGILIEPKPEHAIEVDDDVEVATLRNKLWPIIEEANQIAPAYSKIFKEMILFTSDKKPLPRAGKGTVMRKAALALYEEEITALYATVESSMKTAESVSPPASWTLEDVQTWIVGQASDLVSGAPVSPLVNLFEQGFDSLSSTFLRLRIVGALRGSSHVHSSTTAVRDLPQNLVYSYPVIRDLATYVISLLEPEKALIDPGPQRSALIETMIEKYSFGLNASAATPALGSATSAVVLLTGSTGSIGTEILAKLLEDASVEHIYAFNRPSLESFTIEERHRNRFKESGLDIGLLNTEKVSFISGDATQPNLGLDRGQYSELSRSVTIVIHNAWKLDFNLSLSAFEPNVQSTRHLIDLLQSGPNSGNSRFLFTSSISSAQSWPKSNGPYPEEILMDPSSAIGNGYGEGKYVAERILAKSGVQATSIRIGQVSGGKPKGAWSVTDWVPILVKSSISIGVLPEIKGMISWIPMNVVASAIVEAALSDKILPAALNLVHPRPAEAIDIVRSLQSTISSYLGHHLNIVSFPEWLQTIEKRVQGATAQTLTDIPAIKLLDFFRSISQGNDTLSSSAALGKEAGGLPSFSIDKMVQASYTTLNEVEPIGINDASLWIKYWREIGFVM